MALGPSSQPGKAAPPANLLFGLRMYCTEMGVRGQVQLTAPSRGQRTCRFRASVVCSRFAPFSLPRHRKVLGLTSHAPPQDVS